MERKRTKGRQKIAIRRIERESDCFATFSKRRLGILRKASEISTLCNLDIGLVIYSPTGRPFSFFHPTMESIIGRATSPNGEQPNASDESRLIEAFARTRVSQLNRMLGKLGEELEAEKERERQLETRVEETGGKCPWDGEAIDNFGKEQVEILTGWLENFRSGLVGYRGSIESEE